MNLAGERECWAGKGARPAGAGVAPPEEKQAGWQGSLGKMGMKESGETEGVAGTAEGRWGAEGGRLGAWGSEVRTASREGWAGREERVGVGWEGVAGRVAGRAEGWGVGAG